MRLGAVGDDRGLPRDEPAGGGAQDVPVGVEVALERGRHRGVAQADGGVAVEVAQDDHGVGVQGGRGAAHDAAEHADRVRDVGAGVRGGVQESADERLVAVGQDGVGGDVGGLGVGDRLGEVSVGWRRRARQVATVRA